MTRYFWISCLTLLVLLPIFSGCSSEDTEPSADPATLSVEEKLNVSGIGYFVKMTEDASDDAVFSTGIELWITDDQNYAYNEGIRSAIVTGPGLPEEGVVMTRNYPEKNFAIVDDVDWNTFFDFKEDEVIQTIPTDAEYNVKFYQTLPDEVSLNDQPLYELDTSAAGKPELNADLTTDLFPQLIKPDTHRIDEIDLSGVPAEDYLLVDWKTPENQWTAWLSLWMDDGENSAGVFVELNERGKLIKLEADPLVPKIQAPILEAGLVIVSLDENDRQFVLEWMFR